MATRWYPALCSALLVGCGGSTDVDSTNTGGSGSIDSGVPTGGYWGATGGTTATGGTPVGPAAGGTTATGGTISATGGTTATGGFIGSGVQW